MRVKPEAYAESLEKSRLSYGIWKLTVHFQKKKKKKKKEQRKNYQAVAQRK